MKQPIDFNELYKIYPPFKGKNSLTRDRAIENQTFHNWKVLYRTENFLNSRKPRYVCECSCGKIKSVSKDNLIRGLSKSCGYCNKEFLNINDKRLKKNLSSESLEKKSQIARDVNRGVYKKSTDIDKWFKMMSKQEQLIFEVLEHHGVEFVPHYLVIEPKFRYFFDFYINNQYFIEFDGQQHFRDSIFGSYETIHGKDLIKNQYCFDNNIPIIRIPYDVEWTYEDLFLETTRFLLTPENENEYYSSRMEVN